MESTLKEYTIEIRGSLTGLDNIRNITDKLEELMDTEEVKVVNLDMTETESIESAAITQILVYKKKFSDKNILLRIKGCSERVLKILKMLRLQGSISIVE